MTKEIYFIICLFLICNLVRSQDVFPVPKNKLEISKESITALFYNKIKEDPQKLIYFECPISKNLTPQKLIVNLEDKLLDFKFIWPEGYRAEDAYFRYSFIYFNKNYYEVSNIQNIDSHEEIIFLCSLIVKDYFTLYFREVEGNQSLLVINKNFISQDLDNLLMEVKYLKYEDWLEKNYPTIFSIKDLILTSLMTNKEPSAIDFINTKQVKQYIQNILIVFQNIDYSWSYDYNQSNKDFDLTCTFYANGVLSRHSIKESKWIESNQYLLNQISDNGEISDSNFIKAIALNFLFKLPLEDNKKAQLKMKKLINNLIENQQANGGFTVSSKPASNERVNLPVTSYVASALKECVFADVEKKKCQKAIESIKNLLFSAPFTSDRSSNSKGLAWVYYPNNENDVSEDANYAQFLAIKCFEAISNDRFDFWLRSDRKSVV